MKKLSIILSLLLVASLVMVGFGCTAGEPVPSEGPVPPPEPILVDASYDGKEVEVPDGGSLIVTLESNPTTGFEWSELAQISDQAVLQQLDHKFVSPEETGVVGASGKEVWTFKALKRGESTIFMKYRRPWEEGVGPAKTFILTVVVK